MAHRIYERIAMALERGSIGKDQSAITPLSTGFVYEPYDEKKHGLKPEFRDALDACNELSAFWHTPPDPTETPADRQWRENHIRELRKRTIPLYPERAREFE